MKYLADEIIGASTHYIDRRPNYWMGHILDWYISRTLGLQETEWNLIQEDIEDIEEWWISWGASNQNTTARKLQHLIQDILKQSIKIPRIFPKSIHRTETCRRSSSTSTCNVRYSRLGKIRFMVGSKAGANRRYINYGLRFGLTVPVHGQMDNSSPTTFCVD